MRQVCLECAECGAACDLFAVDKKREAAATVVTLAALVVNNRQKMAVVRQAVDGKVTPRAGGQKRMDDDFVVSTRAQADKAGNQRIGKAGVVVVVAAADLLALGEQDVFCNPLAGVGIEVFIDPIDDTAAGQLEVLGENVTRESR